MRAFLPNLSKQRPITRIRKRSVTKVLKTFIINYHKLLTKKTNSNIRSRRQKRRFRSQKLLLRPVRMKLLSLLRALGRDKLYKMSNRLVLFNKSTRNLTLLSNLSKR